MNDATAHAAAWRQGYDAALTDLESRADQLRNDPSSVTGIITELRARLASSEHVEFRATETAGIPPAELEREWTAG